MECCLPLLKSIKLLSLGDNTKETEFSCSLLSVIRVHIVSTTIAPGSGSVDLKIFDTLCMDFFHLAAKVMWSGAGLGRVKPLQLGC